MCLSVHVVATRLTCDGCPTHQVCVGEVQGGVEQEVGLDDASGSLADVVEQTSALERHSALEAVLQRGQRSSPIKHGSLHYHTYYGRFIVEANGNLLAGLLDRLILTRHYQITLENKGQQRATPKKALV